MTRRTIAFLLIVLCFCAAFKAGVFCYATNFPAQSTHLAAHATPVSNSPALNSPAPIPPHAVSNSPVQPADFDCEAESDMGQGGQNDFIKWVDLNVSYDVLKKVYDLAVKYHGTNTDFDFIQVLAYLALKNGNNFSPKTDGKNLKELVKKLEKKETTVQQMYGGNKYFKYYVNCFSAVFAEFVGEYKTEDGQKGYGLKAYFPVAKGYWYNHYDDFGTKRSYGFKRPHLGHDIMGSVGAPIVAVEGGTITELGWNKYGGWRIGIRSLDTKRYYYYAHLRKGRPYAAGLKLGDKVSAGQVIGYLGMTGYSDKEDTNLKTGKPHLHFGLQLIFDESQADCNSEIWVDAHALTQFLSHNRAQTIKDSETKEYKSVNLRR